MTLPNWATGQGSLQRGRIAVLMTCHNRRELTLSCLRSLFEQKNRDVELSVFLVDDGSIDGTCESVRKEFPEVNLIQGTGRLFWSGGMRLAFHAAAAQYADFHLWLNDDVVLYREAINMLLSTSEQIRLRQLGPVIVAGAVQDPITHQTTYSGLRRRSGWHPLRFDLVEPGPLPKRCDTISGNVVLVSRDAFERLGAIDKAFIHTMGDCDYGLRASRVGGEVWLAAQHVGVCSKGDRRSYDELISSSTLNRLREIGSSKKLPPLPWLTYVRRHGGYLWPILWVGPYAKAVSRPLRDLVESGVRLRTHIQRRAVDREQ